jgi:hypothetical protein
MVITFPLLLEKNKNIFFIVFSDLFLKSFVSRESTIDQGRS